jgi:hypothetical protein
MKFYQVLKHPSGDAEAIADGWNWMAFLFGPLWALSRSMWAVAFGASAATIALDCLALQTGEAAGALMNIVAIVAAVILGSKGNAWRVARLRAKGYERVDTAIAASPGDAIEAVIPRAGLQPPHDSHPPG